MEIRLTPEQSAAYERNGFIVVEGIISREETEVLKERVSEYTHGGRDRSVLQVQVEPRVERGEMQVDHPGDGIRKIDSLVLGDDLFANLGLRSAVVDVIEQILGPDIKLFRNSLMLKPPEVGSQKGWHQDSPYWSIEPMALCSCWLPLDDATPENGCMVVLPGWHKRSPLPHVNVTDDFVIAEGAIDSNAAVEVHMPAGFGLFFHSLLPLETAHNSSPRWRRAMVLSYMSARSRYTGPRDKPDYLHVRGKGYPGCV
jgi:phytanoyl-CoA hydroxylase